MTMTQTTETLVGNSFRLGYRFQRYWDMSMACAFFSAETGAGLFMASTLHGFLPGMLLGLVLVCVLKPYFHLAHMGVPKKSWRAALRPDRSWISRGTLSIGLIAGCGLLHVAQVAGWVALPSALAALAQGGAMAGALLVMCYQGFAMSDSESLALWATPLIPLISFTYSATAGTLLLIALGGGGAGTETLRALAIVLLLADAAVLASLLQRVKRKSKGGAFSVELLTTGQYARDFRQRVVLAGLLAPLVLVVLGGGWRPVVAVAAVAMLFGFFTFRLLVLRAAVFEPITHDLAGGLGLPLPR